MDFDARFTDGRVPDSNIHALFSDEHRWQRWLDVEAALATAEAEYDIIPKAAAQAIASSANIKKLSPERIRNGIKKTSHPLMAIITELSNAVGEPYGGYVHWGATTQNITQTGDALVLHEAHQIFLKFLGKIFTALESLAIKGQNMVCAGRTHGQHAVPVTFGFRASVWIDEFARHVDRLHEVEPRIFTVMIGGAVGNYASLGKNGPKVQNNMAKLLHLRPMHIPARSMSDFQAEYICILGLLAGTCSKIAKEIYILMQPEFGEVYEPIPEGTIGSSTMPHKRNPQLSDDCIAIAAEIRSLVPFAMEGMLHDHEVSGAYSAITDDAIRQASLLMGDLLTRMEVILSGLTLNPERMRANVDITGGLIMSEAIMLKLGESIGRQRAHEIIYEAAQTAESGDKTFQEVLIENENITKYLDVQTLQRLLEPETYTGLSSQLAVEAAERAHALANKLIQ